MVLRNLHRRSRPFRYAGHVGLAMVLLALLDSPRNGWQLAIAAGRSEFVAVLLKDRERFATAPRSGRKVALLMGDDPQLQIVAGYKFDSRTKRQLLLNLFSHTNIGLGDIHPYKMSIL